MWKDFTFLSEFCYSAYLAKEYKENTFEISPQEKSRPSKNILTAKRIRKEPQPSQSSACNHFIPHTMRTVVSQEILHEML